MTDREFPFIHVKTHEFFFFRTARLAKVRGKPKPAPPPLEDLWRMEL